MNKTPAELRKEIRERIAVKFALYKYGGTEEGLYPHWLNSARIEADEILHFLNDKVKIPVEGELPKGVIFRELIVDTNAEEVFIRKDSLAGFKKFIDLKS